MNLPSNWIIRKCSALNVDDIWKHAFGGLELINSLLGIQQDVCAFKSFFFHNAGVCAFYFLLILYYTALQGFGFVFLSLSSSDFDECTLEPNPCDNNADCRNNEGSYTCACKLGYSGDGADCQGIL